MTDYDCIVYWMLHGLLDSVPDVAWLIGYCTGCCMVDWIVYWMLHGRMRSVVDVAWLVV